MARPRLRRLGVALEPFVNDNRGAWVHCSEAFGRKPVRAQRMVTDSRGGIAELLAKAIHKDALVQTFSAEDREKLLPFMRQFGDLDEQFRYRGWTRTGFPNGEAMMEPGEPHDPYPLQTLQIWYPPHGFHQKKGVVLGAYALSPVVGNKFAQLRPEQRLALANASCASGFIGSERSACLFRSLSAYSRS